jgi:hypothetical protein
MRDEHRVLLKAMIVAHLNESRKDTSLSELLDSLREKGEKDDTSIKAALWQLVAEGDVELTPKRTLRIPGSNRTQRELALAT